MSTTPLFEMAHQAFSNQIIFSLNKLEKIFYFFPFFPSYLSIYFFLIFKKNTAFSRNKNRICTRYGNTPLFNALSEKKKK